MALPDAPTGITTNPSSTSVQVSFTQAPVDPPVTNYEVQFDAGAWTALSPADATSPITITGLAAGTNHAAAIRAVNSEGAGTPSSQFFFDTLDPTDGDGWTSPTFYAANGGRTPNGNPPGAGNLDVNDPDD